MGSGPLDEAKSSTTQASQIVQELRSWCEVCGVSQSSLAGEIGVSVSHLNQVLNGRARPSVGLTRRIAEVLERRKARRVNAGRRTF